MSVLPTLIITILTLSLALRYWAFPLLFRRLTQFRVSSFSLITVRGLEWRAAVQADSIVPTLRVERAGWAWGGLKGEEVGLVILRLEGVSYRVKGDAAKIASSKDEHPPWLKSSRRFSAYKGKLLSKLLHLFIHHYPSLARLVSLQVADIRVIFDNLEGLELTLRDIRLGVSVNFEGNVDTPLPGSKPSSPVSPGAEFQPTYPLSPNSPKEASTTGSPSNHFSTFNSFAYSENSSAKISAENIRYDRIAHARRQASNIHSRMTTTASQVWSRAIARAHGSVSFAASIRDIAVILPHLGASGTIREKPSAHDLRPQSHPFVKGMSHKQAFYRSSTPRYALPLPCSEGGYERLLVVEGETRVIFGLGFGPKMGLMGEDTLRSNLKVGQLHTSLGACDKLRELVKVHSGKQEKAAKKIDGKNKWGPQSVPRILLRAFESVTVSLSRLTFSHFLPVSGTPSISARSSATDLTIFTPSDADCFIVSMDLIDVSCQLSAADSSNNDRARNAFGTNPSPESKVRGVAFGLLWQSIALQCVAPGETSDDKSQLIAVRQAEFDGLITWRPSGWTREDLLFVNDPNLALIVGKGSMASIDVAGDVQLLNELTEAWQHSRPQGNSSGPAAVDSPNQIELPPRIRMVVQVGHAM
ncbi:MAG: hypothetical protein TREMPRED_005996, partial [Tremellales sp. Tagirdzhanova-0007]